MIIGVPKEIKDNEYRVGMTPAGVATMKDAGHRVVVEKGAGLGSGITDEEFINAGAEILSGPADVYNAADMIIKVEATSRRIRPYERRTNTICVFAFGCRKRVD